MTDHGLHVGTVEDSYLKRRYRSEARFKLMGKLAVSVAIVFLAVLLYSIVSKAIPAFTTTEVRINITYDPQDMGLGANWDEEALKDASYAKLIRKSLLAKFPQVSSRRDKLLLYRMVSKQSSITVRDRIVENPALIGQTETLWLLAATNVDQFLKGNIDKTVPEHLRQMSDKEVSWIEQMKEEGNIRNRFNYLLFTESDSREPELAGLLGATVGSLFTIFVCLLLAFPVGVGAAVYLEEFAPKNVLTDFIEININNLAAVPSIIYGMLGLSIYLSWFGMPRSSALVGGLTLALLILPVVVIATRNSIRAIPPSIKDAALGLGASPMQVTLHHTIPLALPGIMTGTILGVARALGETAPLLMIGMVAFVADVPGSITDPATALPVQVYLWSDSPEVAFIEKTSAAILVLLVFLICANALAVYIRQRFEKKW